MSERVTVLSPLGFPPKVRPKALSPGLERLDGKKVFLVDVGFENSDNFMLQLERWFADHRPETATEVVRWHDQHQPDPELCTRIKAEGDAAILGVGL
jgi:hypothetical protein